MDSVGILYLEAQERVRDQGAEEARASISEYLGCLASVPVVAFFPLASRVAEVRSKANTAVLVSRDGTRFA